MNPFRKTVLTSLTILWCAIAAAAPAVPLVVADFETAESVALWSGLPCAQTTSHASSGSHGMSFAIPKYVEGQEARPGVVLPCGEGKGFALADFGPYKTLSIDVWVEGDKPGKLGLALRDKDGEKSWTAHITVEPGKVNHADLSLAEAGADSDIHHISEILLYALRPETAFTLAVDNLRLTPCDPAPVAVFDLVYPNYRGLVFPGEEDVEVAVQVAAKENGFSPRDLSVNLSLDNGAHKAVKKFAVNTTGRYTMPVDLLTDQPGTLSAVVVKKADGAVLTSKSWTVRRLTVAQRDALRTYVDRHNTTIADGKPFFPLGWYSNTNEDRLKEVADSPFNTILAYGTDFASKSSMLRYLDLVQESGLKLVYCMNDVYPTATYFDKKTWEGVTGNDAISAAILSAYKNSPAILAWYLNDELPHKLVPQLEDYYQRTAAADPTRPCFIVLCNRSELQYFPTTTDIMGVDPYPIPQDPIVRVSSFVDKATAAVSGHKPVWLVPQAFGWYQYNSKNPDRGHTPTEAELKTGRAPTYEEERCMTYLGLTHGAKGLIYYCYYDLRVLPQYAEMWGWMKKIAAEVKQLEPVLLSPEDLGTVKTTPDDGAIHTRLKRCNGRLYLIAVSSDRNPRHVQFDLKRLLPNKVTVMFENREVPAHRRRLDADFAPLEAHIYDLGPGK